MKIREVEVEVLAEDVAVIERLSNEVAGGQNIIDYMMTKHKDEPDILETATFKKYHDTLSKNIVNLEEEKDNLAKKYLPEGVLAKDIVSWTLVYKTRTLVYRIKEECDGSNCKCKKQ